MNVSEGFQLRTAYKKKVKPSKLDGLLERRVRQFTLEEKHRLERMRQTLSKTAASKATSGVKTEGTALTKQQAAITSGVKAEEEENQQVKDHVVKKLNFEEEDKKTESMDIKSDPEIKEESCTNKEVNGESELSCQSEKIEPIEKTLNQEVSQKPENPKKRGYDEMEQSSGKSDTENTEESQSKSDPSPQNGKITAADPNVNSEPGTRVQTVVSDPEKEPVKSLMNGNLSQNEFSNAAHPPPLKVPKLENHVGDKGEPVDKSDPVTMDSEGLVPAKLEPSSTSCHISNNADICTNRDGVKTSVNNVSSKEPLARDTSSSIGKPGVPSQGEMSSLSSGTGPSTTQPGVEAAGSQKKKLNDTKTGLSSAGSMISKEYSTRDRVSLLRFSKSKKARSGIALPSYRKFVTKSSKKSLFVLPNDDLKRLARKAGIKEVPIFSYNAKPALDIWPYPSPRPTFGITWRFVTNFFRTFGIIRMTAWTFLKVFFLGKLKLMYFSDPSGTVCRL